MRRLAVLEEFARAPVAPVAGPVDRCGLCDGAVEPGHAHVVDLERRTLACTCRACHLLLARPEAARGRYRGLPERVLVDPEFVLGDAQWAALQIPVGLAFLWMATGEGGARWVATYPSAAGATEWPLPVEPWRAVEAAPLVRALLPDIEALLVFARPGHPGREIFLVPIDVCYALVGLVRQRWRGFSGGAALWQAIDHFFAELRGRARALRPVQEVP